LARAGRSQRSSGKGRGSEKILGSSTSELIPGILGVKRFDFGFFLGVSDFHAMPSNPLEKSRQSTNTHKKQPSEESAECVADHIRNARIHSRKIRHT
jgi:hypothetical protein